MDNTRIWLAQLLNLSAPALAGLALAGLKIQYVGDDDKIQEHINRFIAQQNDRLN